METKERINRGAGKLFFSRGIKHVTMDDLAFEVGMSKRTIYENFHDKTEVLRSAIEFFQEEHDQDIKKITEGSGNVMEVVIGILCYVQEEFKAVNPVYLEDLKKYYPVVWSETVQKSRESSQLKLQALLNRGKDEGLFREDINSALVARIFYEQITLIHNNEAFPIDEFPRKELFKNMFLNFARGISTLKGVEVLEKLLSGTDLC